jgi:hypothetical protein
MRPTTVQLHRAANSAGRLPPPNAAHLLGRAAVSNSEEDKRRFLMNSKHEIQPLDRAEMTAVEGGLDIQEFGAISKSLTGRQYLADVRLARKLTDETYQLTPEQISAVWGGLPGVPTGPRGW